MNRNKWLWGTGIVFLAAIIIVIGVRLIPGQSNYPPAKDQFVNDYAQVLKSDDVQNLRKQLRNLKREQGIEGTVLTIHSIEDYDTDDESLEAFATHLFNTWGIGNRTKNDGFLVLVAVNDRKVRIEVGKGYGSDLNRELQRIINRKMLPEFRDEKYSQGIYEGTISTIDVISEGREIVPQKSSVNIWVYVGVVVGILVVFGGLFGLMIYDSSKLISSSKKRRDRFKRYRSRGGYLDDGGGGSSGGGSFGGGSSAGDGASGDW